MRVPYLVWKPCPALGLVPSCSTLVLPLALLS